MARERRLEVIIAGDARQFQRTLGVAESGLQRFGRTVGRGVRTVATWGVAAAGAGAAAATAFGVSAVAAAAELNETLSKTDQVFGDTSKEVRRFADEMADKFGLVKNVTLDAASNIGLVAKASGLAAPEAAKMSMEMAKLAADASSFFNVPLDVALEKIRSGLVGEAEPLRQFGVLLSAARVEAKALEMGLVDSNGEITEQAKVAARAAIILEDMKDASGDLDRTQDSLSNRVRELKGRFENMRTEIGQKLMPIAEKIVAWADRNAPAAFEKLEGFVGRLVDAFGTDGLAGVMSVLGEEWEKAWNGTIKPLFENTILPWFENTLLPKFTAWIVNVAAPAIGEASVHIGIAMIKGIGRGLASAVTNMPKWQRPLLFGLTGQAINFAEMAGLGGAGGGGGGGGGVSRSSGGGGSRLAFHDGGVVPGRPGQEVPAILKAGETVLPTHKSNAGIGSTFNVTVNTSSADVAADAVWAIRKLAAVVA